MAARYLLLLLFLLLYSTLLLLALAAPSHGLTQADVAKRLKDELWERNRGHEMLKSWNGDPCSPSTWEGFTCRSNDSALVVTKLNLSSKKLQGPIPQAIGNLTELNELDLQDNNFTGSLPASLSALKHLMKLSVNCNPFLNNQPPDGLSTGVDFSYGGCAAEEYQNPPSVAGQKIFVIGGVAGGSLACTFALGMFFVCFNKREHRHPKPDCSTTTSISPDLSYVQIIIQNFGWREEKANNGYRL